MPKWKKKNRITDLTQLEPVGSGSAPVGLLETQTPRPRPTPTDPRVVPICINSWGSWYSERRQTGFLVLIVVRIPSQTAIQTLINYHRRQDGRWGKQPKGDKQQIRIVQLKWPGWPKGLSSQKFTETIRVTAFKTITGHSLRRSR